MGCRRAARSMRLPFCIVVATGSGSPADLALTQSLDECHPPDLRPLLHCQHLPSSGLDRLIEPGSGPGRMAPVLRWVDQV